MRILGIVLPATAVLLVSACAIGACGGDDDLPSLRHGASSSSTDGGESSSGSSSSSSSSSSGATPNDASSGGGGSADADTTPQGPDESGEATYYDADGTGACGFKASTDFLVCAINDEEYSKANCGRCVAVTGPKGTVTVRIVDKCPGCDKGDLDLSETAFTKIADKSAGRIKITWHFVACP